MRHSHCLSDEGMKQIQTISKIFGSFVESLAKSVSRLAIAIEDSNKQKEKCRKDKHD